MKLTSSNAFLLAAFVLSLLFTGAAADPLTVPIGDQGPISTPPSAEVPLVCDPIPVICIGPVTVPLPFQVSFETDGVEATVDPEGAPPMVLGPFRENLTVAGITVPIVVCPATCVVPATPDGSVDGQVTATVDGPIPCTVAASTTGVTPSCAGTDQCDQGEIGAIEPACTPLPPPAECLAVAPSTCVAEVLALVAFVEQLVCGTAGSEPGGLPGCLLFDPADPLCAALEDAMLPGCDDLGDGDGDGVPDAADRCPGEDDTVPGNCEPQALGMQSCGAGIEPVWPGTPIYVCRDSNPWFITGLLGMDGFTIIVSGYSVTHI